MQLIDEVLAQIEEHRFSSFAEFLAQALASACSKHYSISLLDAAVKLDRNNKQILFRMMSITSEPDFSNADQAAAIRRLRELELID